MIVYDAEDEVSPPHWAVLPLLFLLFILFLIEENSFDLVSMGRMGCFQAKMAQKTQGSCKKKVSSIASVTFHLSPFVRCLADKHKLRYVHSCNQVEHLTV